MQKAHALSFLCFCVCVVREFNLCCRWHSDARPGDRQRKRTIALRPSSSGAQRQRRSCRMVQRRAHANLQVIYYLEQMQTDAIFTRKFEEFVYILSKRAVT